MPDGRPEGSSSEESRVTGYQEAVAVIMAGGSGTRFWPVSNPEKPKQFLRLVGQGTMLQQTVARLQGLVSPERILILTNQRYVELARDQVPEIPEGNVLGEPMARDTAAAVTLGAVWCRSRFGNLPMMVLPADHLIHPGDVFQRNLQSAVQAVTGRCAGSLYTFGIAPTYPAVGYGYLLAGDRVWLDGDVEHLEVQQFREKPDLDTARQYVESGSFYWNSGIFVWQAADILAELERLLPQHVHNLESAMQSYGTGQWDAELARAFEPLTRTSIDFGVMEHARSVNMVAAQFQWDDIGGWNAVAQYLSRDQWGNALQGRVEALESRDNVVFCQDEEELVALIGVRDLVVVRAGPRTLVVSRDRAEEVKQLVERLGE